MLASFKSCSGLKSERKVKRDRDEEGEGGERKGMEGEREGKEGVRKKERGGRGRRGKRSPCSDFTI